MAKKKPAKHSPKPLTSWSNQLKDQLKGKDVSQLKCHLVRTPHFVQYHFEELNIHGSTNKEDEIQLLESIAKTAESETGAE